MIRRLVGIFIILAAGALVLLAIQSRGSKPESAVEGTVQTATPQSPKDVFEFERAQARKTKLSGRLGQDDGFIAAIFFGGDIMGNLEVCGCPKNPLGGIARRQGYIRLFKERYPDVPFLHVDTGYFFSDRVDLMTGELAEDVVVGNEWVIRAYEHMKLDAVNLSYHDLPQLARCFRSEEFRHHAAATPVVKHFLSANVRAREASYANPQPYVIRELSGGRLNRRTLRIGFIGVTESGNYRGREFVVLDPLAAVRSLVLRVRARADLVVVLAYLSPEMIETLARENPEVDVILADVGRPLWLQPKTIGRTYIAYSVYQTKLLGELRIYDEQGGRWRVVARYVELDGLIPDDPATEALRAEARSELAAVQRRIAERATAASRRARHAASGDGAMFVGSRACQPCHDSAYAVWTESGHAHAFATLQKVKRENDPQCLGCHVTGYEQPGGFLNVFSTPRLKDVQCEACHGPASRHLEDPTRPYGKVGVPEGCLPCHTRENSPDFEPLSYWAKIKH
ncbi:MAG: hypothetical protein N0A16_07485 [Blastocatellia bacterium]|nr:hypothetical protein [Blastocatellia bacterium]MCS7157555.1 hypothetical protein [Blastocatellia bacterium]MCX7753507.1 hypothetical protein [Blastocatellia bacterium]MDW8166923.1 multiheme c-type cytochrome [Acidobacteriota bacterium]MDW8257500.1 multiheme c-type cytochrome [Acidobacteriota bacterium]